MDGDGAQVTLPLTASEKVQVHRTLARWIG